MNSELELLAARKQLLVARASLQRLQAAGHADALAQSLRWPTRIASALRWASVAIAVIRLVRRR